MGFNWGAAAAGVGVGVVTGNPMAGLATYSAMDASSQAQKAQEKANEQNVSLTKESWSETERLSNTAHQREMADLEAAGLNPILSAKYGGSSTPSLSAPQVQSTAPLIMQGQQSAYQQMNDSRNYGLAVENFKLNNENIRSQIATQRSQQIVNSAQAVKIGADAQRQMLENDVLEQDSKNRLYEESRRQNRPAWQKDLGIDVQDSVGTVFGPLRDLFKRERR